MPIFVLVRYARPFRSILLLRNFSRVIKDHKLIYAQIFLISKLPVRHLKADVPRVIGNSKLIAGHILMILCAGIHISFCNRGLPSLTICTYRNPHTVLRQIHIGRTECRPDPADAVCVPKVHCEQLHRCVSPGSIRQASAWHAPITLFCFHIGTVCFAAFRQDNIIVLFHDFQKLFFIVKRCRDAERIHDRFIFYDRTAVPVVCIHFLNIHCIISGISIVRYFHLDFVAARFAHIDCKISFIVQITAVHPYLGSIRLGKGIYLYLIDRTVRRAFILCDLRRKSGVIDRNPVRNLSQRSKLVYPVNDQVLKLRRIGIGRLCADCRYKCN